MQVAAISSTIGHPVVVVPDWLPIPRRLTFLVELGSRHNVLHLLVAVVGVVVALQRLVLRPVEILVALQLLLLLLAIVVHLLLARLVLCVGAFLV